MYVSEVLVNGTKWLWRIRRDEFYAPWMDDHELVRP
jgi:hypothetical protein